MKARDVQRESYSSDLGRWMETGSEMLNSCEYTLSAGIHLIAT